MKRVADNRAHADDLGTTLAHIFGRMRAMPEKNAVGMVALGNHAHGDDGAGLVLATQLQAMGYAVYFAGHEPERHLHQLRALPWSCLIFLDAVDFGAPAGATLWCDRASLGNRFPQLSTHRLSLGMIAEYLANDGAKDIFLLGMQPQTLTGTTLSPALNTSVAALRQLFQSFAPDQYPVHHAPAC